MPAKAPESLPMGVRLPETMTEPGMEILLVDGWPDGGPETTDHRGDRDVTSTTTASEPECTERTHSARADPRVAGEGSPHDPRNRSRSPGAGSVRAS
jgi:hypothetical protein